MMEILEMLGLNLLLLAKVALILVGAFVLERVVRIALKRMYLRSDKGQEDRTRYRFMRNGTRFLVTVLALCAIVYSIPALHDIAVGLFAGAGILAIIIGFAAQGAFSNIVSGIFIVSFKPFRVGDSIRVGDSFSGVVEDITLRHTVLVTTENRRVIIPNAKISDETIVNSSIGDEATCQFVEVGISYESNLDKAIEALREEAELHPHCIDRRTPEELEAGEPRVAVRVVQLADSSVLLRAYAWAKDPVIARQMHFDLNRSVKLRFDREGIVIPYPQRTVHLSGPVFVRQAPDEKGQ
jgi:small conductance mechanosensitive channel